MQVVLPALKLGLHCVELEWSMSCFDPQRLYCHLKLCLGIDTKPAYCYQQKELQHCPSSFFHVVASGVRPMPPPVVSSQNLGRKKGSYICQSAVNYHYTIQREFHTPVSEGDKTYQSLQGKDQEGSWKEQQFLHVQIGALPFRMYHQGDFLQNQMSIST